MRHAGVIWQLTASACWQDYSELVLASGLCCSEVAWPRQQAIAIRLVVDSAEDHSQQALHYTVPRLSACLSGAALVCAL